MAAIKSMHIREVTHQITLHVRGIKSFGFRLRIAGWLFRLGAKIAGVGIIFETTKPGDEWRSFARADTRRSLVDQINEELADGKRLKL